MMIGKGGTNSIGAGVIFASVAAGDEVDTGKLAANCGITDDIQQTSMGIAQYNDIAGVSEKVYEMAHHRACRWYSQVLTGGANILELGLHGS